MTSIKVAIEKKITMFSIAFFVDLQLFDSYSIVEKCMLENQYKTLTMIDFESDDYDFIDPVTAQKVCDKLEIVFIELIKYRMTKRYNEKKGTSIIHVI